MSTSPRKKKTTVKKKEPASVPSSARPNRALEAFGVVLMVLALGLCLAIFTYESKDHSGSSNLVGPVGHALADAVLGAVGIGGYLAALVSILIAGATILGRIKVPSPLSFLSIASLTIGATILGEQIFSAKAWFGHPTGGMVGVVLTELLGSLVGLGGTFLVASGLILLSLMGLTHLSPSRLLDSSLALLRGMGIVAGSQVKIWNEARDAGAAREEELIDAARSSRAQAELQKTQKEAALRESLKEKQRIAVLKATAKAEERALKKIASLEAKSRVEAQADTPEEQEPAPEVVVAGADRVSETPVEAPAVASEKPATSPQESSSGPEVVALDIPGPAAEPEVVIGNLQNSADIIDAIDSASRLPEKQEIPVVQAPPAAKEAVSSIDATSQIVDEAPVDSSEPVAEKLAAAKKPVAEFADKPPEGEDGPMIHERKQVEVEFDDEVPKSGALKALKRALKKEKKVYELPPINLLDHEGDEPEEVDQLLLRERAMVLEEKLKTYNVHGKVTAIRPGPVVTTYEYQPAAGVKVSKIAGLSDDIAMSMKAVRVRIVAPIPGRGVVGIELPNDGRENVYLKEIIAHDSFKKSKSLLTLALGKDAEGDPQSRDLQQMPHLLVAGTTGSGKSVSINTMILSILYKATPEEVKFIMVDPKMLELSRYNDIPHLLLPVVTDPQKASLALQWAVDEMERRYQMLSDMKVRDLKTFNKRLANLRKQREEEERAREEAEAAQAALEQAEDGPEVIVPEVLEPSDIPDKSRLYDPWPDKDLPDHLPYIVVLIDEFADLMTVASKDVEASVQRLAQKARAAGIHVLLATQRPSTDVITGVIKNNFPSRIAFRVASRHDSATIINSPGAENLLGRGDSLFLSVASPSPERIHGSFVSEEEVERVVEFWKAQGKPKYDPTILQKREEEGASVDMEDVDEHYDMAVQIVTETQKASISALQRRLRVGYNRAARMIEMMEAQGIVGPTRGPKGEREVLVRAIAE